MLLIDLARRLSTTLMSRLILNLHQTANTPAGYSIFESMFKYELANAATYMPAQPRPVGDVVLDDPTVNGTERTNIV